MLKPGWVTLLLATSVVMAACAGGDAVSYGAQPEILGTSRSPYQIESLPELAATADVIVVGSVIGESQGRRMGRLDDLDTARLVHLEVDVALKGAKVGDLVRFEQGGWTKDGVGYTSFDVPWSEKGEELIVFLKRVDAPDLTGLKQDPASVVDVPFVVSLQLLGNASYVSLTAYEEQFNSDLYTSGTPEGMLREAEAAVGEAESRGMSAVQPATGDLDLGAPIRTLLLAESKDPERALVVTLALHRDGGCIEATIEGRRQQPLCLSAADFAAATEDGKASMYLSEPPGYLVVRSGDVGSEAVNFEGKTVNVELTFVREVGISFGFAPSDRSDAELNPISNSVEE